MAKRALILAVLLWGCGPQPAPSGDSVDLGTLRAGDLVTFEVPPGTLGFTVLVDASPVTSSDFLGLQELRDPSGKVLVSDFLGVARPGRVLQGQNGTGFGGVRVPLTDDDAAQALPSGRWTARLGGSTLVGGAKGSTTAFTGQVHGRVAFQVSSDGAFHRGVLDLDLYVPDSVRIFSGKGSHPLTAASAPTDAELQDRLTLAFGLFERLFGLSRGAVRYHSVAGSVGVISGQAAVDEANQLATQVNAQPAAQIVLANTVDPDAGGGTLSGLTNCLPGAVGVPGTKCSAVLWALRDVPPWEEASVLVHELGHFAGLRHTTEFEGGDDQLSDTPGCADTSKAGLAGCPDHTNLMFPSANQVSDAESIVVSPTQRAILRGSSLYHSP